MFWNAAMKITPLEDVTINHLIIFVTMLHSTAMGSHGGGVGVGGVLFGFFFHTKLPKCINESSVTSSLYHSE